MQDRSTHSHHRLIASSRHPLRRLGLAAACVLALLGTAHAWTDPVTSADPARNEAATDSATWAARHTESQLFTAILAAELALAQGDRATAVGLYAEIARLSTDEGVAERAVELLLRAGDRARAANVVETWARAHPSSARPRLLALALALAADSPRTREAIDAILGLPVAALPGALMDAARQLAQARDREQALAFGRHVAERLPAVAEAHYLHAVAATGTTGRNAEIALAALARALELRPLWPQAIAVRARLLLATAPADRRAAVQRELLAELAAATARHPDSRELRELHARALYDADRFAEARRMFLALAEDGQDDVDEMRFAATLAAFAARDWRTAEAELREAEAAGRGDPTALAYYLARALEGQGRWVEAAERYGQIDRGERAFEAQLRRAYALAKARRTLEAIAVLKSLEPANPRQAYAVAQSMAGVWREAREYRRALAILDGLLAQTPDDVELLYDTAILLEQLKQPVEAERRLRRALELEPDRAHTLNALGYSLADRNERLDEARHLIERALQLAPDDAAIIDSLGWVAFRQGRLDEAERYLRLALSKQADGEIAAHLGEVLWTMGRREEARSVWESQLAREPEHELLRATMQRLDPR